MAFDLRSLSPTYEPRQEDWESYPDDVTASQLGDALDRVWCGHELSRIVLAIYHGTGSLQGLQKDLRDLVDLELCKMGRGE